MKSRGPQVYAGDSGIGEYLDLLYHDEKIIKNCFDGDGHSWKLTSKKTHARKVFVVCRKCGIRKKPNDGRKSSIQV